MTSTAPGATGTAPDEPLLRRLMRATEVDTRMIGMIAALALIWVGFHSTRSSRAARACSCRRATCGI